MCFFNISRFKKKYENINIYVYNQTKLHITGTFPTFFTYSHHNVRPLYLHHENALPGLFDLPLNDPSTTKYSFMNLVTREGFKMAPTGFAADRRDGGGGGQRPDLPHPHQGC